MNIFIEMNIGRMNMIFKDKLLKYIYKALD